MVSRTVRDVSVVEVEFDRAITLQLRNATDALHAHSTEKRISTREFDVQ